MTGMRKAHVSPDFIEAGSHEHTNPGLVANQANTILGISDGKVVNRILLIPAQEAAKSTVD
jgi:hypothetical protein